MGSVVFLSAAFEVSLFDGMSICTVREPLSFGWTRTEGIFLGIFSDFSGLIKVDSEYSREDGQWGVPFYLPIGTLFDRRM
jgi:hypothetical protein